MLISVSDAPVANAASERLMQLVNAQAPMREVANALFHDYGLLERFNSLPASKHPQGFLTYKLAISEDQQRALRLHIWLPHKRDMADQPGFEIHDHIFGFTSALLAGETVNKVYAVQPSEVETGLRRFPCVYHSSQEDGLRREEQPVSVRHANAQAVRAGAFYTMPPGAYHTSDVPQDSFTITLLAATASSQPYPYLVGPKDAAVPASMRRAVPDAADLPLIVAKLRSVRDSFSPA